MPYGYNPALPPPPAEQLPISPYAPQMRRPIAMPGQLPPPPEISQGLNQQNADMQAAGRTPEIGLRQLIPSLAGLGMTIFGGKNVGNFGAGFTQGSSNMLMQQNLQARQREAAQEENVIKNVHAQMEKVRRIPDPKYQAAVQQYDQAMLDGKLTAKEAAKISQSVMGLGNIEGELKRQADKDELEQRRLLAEMERKIEMEGGGTVDIEGKPIQLTGKQYADYQIGQQRLTAQEAAANARAQAAEAAATRREAENARREEGRDRRLLLIQNNMGSRFSRRQDQQFQGKMSEFVGADKALDAIDAALKRYQNTSVLHPLDLGLAADRLKATVGSFSTAIGRKLGERGVFTDADREAFKGILTPGIVLSKMAPEEAIGRLTNLRNTLEDVKRRELDAYGFINPDSPLLDFYENKMYKDMSYGTPATADTPPGLADAGKKPPGLRNPDTEPHQLKERPGKWFVKKWGPKGYGEYQVSGPNASQ